MPTYSVRIVAEAGTDPVGGTPLGYDQEILTIEADSLWAARSRAIHRMTLSPMGRVLRIYDAEAGDEIVHPSPSSFRQGRFRIDGLPGTYDGFTRDETWNGFAVPYFSLEEARRVAHYYAAQLAGPDGQAQSDYDTDRNIIRLYDPSSGQWDDYSPVNVEGRMLYPIGTRDWTWEEVSGAAG